MGKKIGYQLNLLKIFLSSIFTLIVKISPSFPLPWMVTELQAWERDTQVLRYMEVLFWTRRTLHLRVTLGRPPTLYQKSISYFFPYDGRITLFLNDSIPIPITIALLHTAKKSLLYNFFMQVYIELRLASNDGHHFWMTHPSHLVHWMTQISKIILFLFLFIVKKPIYRSLFLACRGTNWESNPIWIWQFSDIFDHI